MNATDPFKFTTIGHANHRLCSPLSEARRGLLGGSLGLGGEARTVDLAGGKGELSIRLAECFGSSGVVVERNPSYVEAGRAAVAERAPGAVEFQLGDAAEAEFEESFDLVVCVGARPFGDRAQTLAALAARTRPGGEVLIGEGYYRSQPPEAFLETIGEGPEEGAVRFIDHIELAQGMGLTPLYSLASTVEEFDHYDGLYRATLLRYAAEHPDDPDAVAIAARTRAWHELYHRWGRELWGFGWYLFGGVEGVLCCCGRAFGRAELRTGLRG